MNPDFVDLLRALLAAEATFMVVGAYAVGVHGRPRATKDLDVWVEPSVDNAPKVIRALIDFGAPLMGLTAKDLEAPGVGACSPCATPRGPSRKPPAWRCRRDSCNCCAPAVGNH
jgi:hypothetical protein